MANEIEKYQRKLPTFDDIKFDADLTTDEKANNYMVLLNQEPPKQWVKDHPFISGHKYLSISRVEYLLRRIYVRYRIEVIKTGMLLNCVECTVRVHYENPLTGEWDFHDGVAAQEIQTAKGSGSLKLDMSNINKSAVTMALPIAKSLAIKDACHHIGRIFGGELDRKDEISYRDLLVEPRAVADVNLSKEKIRLIEFLKDCKTVSYLQAKRADFAKHGLTVELDNRIMELENATV